ncbi:hypothetical protein LJC42_03400 [Eubacteriales bacterium OttesenSCG-928-K08]|nr:hypothetical protein [Eubacteriales bacterium OttesenSCG-928-K08]
MLVAASVVLLAALLILILKSKFLPGNIMAMLPLAIALIIGTGFTETLTMAHEGIVDVAAVVVMFIFATVYFGVMSDVGLFEPIIGRLMRIKGVGKSIFSVVAVAALIAMLAHLDGQGVTTLVVTVPPMLIVFDKLKIRRPLMALIFSTVVGCMNMLPWGGPVARAATVINMDVMELYKQMVPVQLIGLVLSFGVLFLASRQEQKRGEFTPSSEVSFGQVEVSEASEQVQALRRPKLFWFNLALTVVLLVLLFAGVPAHIGFIFGCAVALPVNYRSIKEQNARIKAHAGNLLIAVYTIVGAGVLLGIMEGTGMFEALATAIVSIIPPALSNYVHIILGLLSTPLSFLLNTDAMIYGILPVAVNIGAQYGVSAVTIAAMIISGRVIGAGLCITTPSVYLGLGLMQIDYKDGFKLVFKWALLLGSILVLLSALLVR